MSSTNGATFYIVSNVCVIFGPVDMSPSYMGHLLCTLVTIVKVI